MVSFRQKLAEDQHAFQQGLLGFRSWDKNRVKNRHGFCEDSLDNLGAELSSAHWLLFMNV